MRLKRSITFNKRLIVLAHCIARLGSRAGEDSVEGFTHDRRTANPDPLDFVSAVFGDLLSDKVIVPALRVHFLLRETHVEAEVGNFFSLAVAVKGFEQFKGDSISTSRIRNVKVELEVLGVDLFHVL